MLLEIWNAIVSLITMFQKLHFVFGRDVFFLFRHKLLTYLFGLRLKTESKTHKDNELNLELYLFV